MTMTLGLRGPGRPPQGAVFDTWAQDVLEGKGSGKEWPGGRRDRTGTTAPSFRAGLAPRSTGGGGGRASKGFQQV